MATVTVTPRLNRARLSAARRKQLDDRARWSAQFRRDKPAGPGGFPKKLPCLVCDRPRVAEWAGDRIHAKCRAARLSSVEQSMYDVHRPKRERRDYE